MFLVLGSLAVKSARPAWAMADVELDSCKRSCIDEVLKSQSGTPPSVAEKACAMGCAETEVNLRSDYGSPVSDSEMNPVEKLGSDTFKGFFKGFSKAPLGPDWVAEQYAGGTNPLLRAYSSARKRQQEELSKGVKPSQ
eukprot:TRINITY_DN33460_c0_g1_i1.p2 TRINITY_DN33460_c0_g1~~TRINITY_DN33460_c0_g1_i1.p2  ORF type:complete len:138 (-),score=31.67 TRINITY_DN33460_c0_g1_i1:234-647(-)